MNFVSHYSNTFKLFAGWEVRIVKNFDRGLENAARPQAEEGSIFKSEVKVFNSSYPPNFYFKFIAGPQI